MIKDTVVFCSSTAGDRVYEAFCWAKSVRCHYPTHRIVFDALCYDDPNEIIKLEDIGVEVNQYDESNFPEYFSRDQIIPLTKQKNARKHSYISLVCASWRLFMLPRVMGQYNCPVMWLDTDTLMRRPIDELFDAFEGHDWCIVHREGKAKTNDTQFLSSVYILNNTPKGIQFTNQLPITYQGCRRKAGWYADQRTLWGVFNDVHPDMLPMDYTYNHSGLPDDAAIWHCKHGRNRRQRKLWLDESRKYAEMVLP
jgi:hypothetical protein